MVKKVVCFALGGHIATQNASFRKLIKILKPKDYRFYGAENGFEAFETGIVHKLRAKDIPKNFAGFVAGANRASLYNKDGSLNAETMQRAQDFFKKGKFDIAVASAGDDHGMQMQVLNKTLDNLVDVYVINKTMDNDLGGLLPCTDFTNGFHTACNVGIESMKNHYAGTWTNNLAYLVSPFGRDTNWVGAVMAYWGHGRLIYDELPEGHQGHGVDKIYEIILEEQAKNERKYGKRIAMLVVSEGTKISGIEHVDKKLIDAHGHHKLNPETLVSNLKKELDLRYRIKTQSIGITYEMRNSPPTSDDIDYAEASAEIIADAIKRGEKGVESTFEIQGDDVYVDVAPIEKVSEKRFVFSHIKPLIDYQEFRVTDEIGKYYKTLFGERKNLRDWLPGKPRKVCVY